MNTRFFAAFASLALCAVVPTSAFATQSTGTVNVSASVSPDCILSVPSGTLALGAVDPLLSSTPAATSSSVSVQCNAGSPYTIGLGATAGATPAFATTSLAMANGTHNLNYTAALASYGATAPSSTLVTDALTLTIGSGQNAFVGAYSGSFVVTVVF
jgi:spore coat protein U-like protein